MIRRQRKYFSVGRLLFVFIGIAQLGACTESSDVVEFCLDGEFDLGARYQGMQPVSGERYPTRFCYITDNSSGHMQFAGSGQSNPDMHGDFVVSYLVPDRVRIVNRQSPPDVEFSGKRIVDEALRHRRADPKQLVAELEAHPEWVKESSDDGWHTVQYPGAPFETRIRIDEKNVVEVHALVDMPLRGRVTVLWQWQWPNDRAPELKVFIEDDIVFDAQATWRELGPEEADNLWQLSDGQDAVALSGDRWPARIHMQMQNVADGVHLVSGVRTGFAHIIVETTSGLIVGDAPAGWLELQQLPPADLVPGMGISGLSENFIDFLATKFPDMPIRAVAITHAHDDHSGGARAFAAAGADVYAPAGIASFLTDALNRSEMPDDRLGRQNGRVTIESVQDRSILDDSKNVVELVVLPRGPHVSTALGIWARDARVFFQSDLHVPNSDVEMPREDRANTECWFAEWAVENLPRDTIVVNSHTRPQTPVSRLEKYLGSDTCRALKETSGRQLSLR